MDPVLMVFALLAGYIVYVFIGACVVIWTDDLTKRRTESRLVPWVIHFWPLVVGLVVFFAMRYGWPAEEVNHGETPR